MSPRVCAARSRVLLLALSLVSCECRSGDTAPDGGGRDGAIGPGIGEICGNGADDDGDGRADCEDDECRAAALGEGPADVELADAYRHLFEPGSGACAGAPPLQRGIEPGAIDDGALAIVRGRIIARDSGAPIAGAEARVVGVPELGVAVTSATGEITMAVRGGTSIVSIAAEGFLGVQRVASVGPGRFTWIGEIALTVADSRATVIRSDADDVQVHQGSEIVDASGTRRATLVFAPDTRARLRARDGTLLRELDAITVRATEYTVGERGSRAMPAELPIESGYTYAVELTADEAPDLEGTTVSFSRDVSLFVENFLGFEVGGAVPLGSYDRSVGEWIAEPDGRVIRILSIEAGVAQVDTDGDGAPDDQIGEAQRRALAGLYRAGAELWWSEIDHFTPWDCNWPFGPPEGAEGPFGLGGFAGDPPCRRGGSVIECESQVLGESIPLPGTGQELHYRSDRAPGRAPAREIVVSYDATSLPAGVTEVRVEVDVAGAHHEWVLPPTPGAIFRWSWNGIDSVGREVPGLQLAVVHVRYGYRGVYREPSTDDPSFAEPGVEVTGIVAREMVYLARRFEIEVGKYDARRHGIGGWTLSSHHHYARAARTVLLGDGERIDLRRSGAEVREIAHTGGALAPAPGGRVFVAGGGRVVRVSLDGAGEPFAGTGAVDASRGDGGPATAATFLGGVSAIAASDDGSVYVAEAANPFVGGSCVRRITPAGVIEAFAGRCGEAGDDGDGGPATLATFGTLVSLSVGSAGDLFVADAAYGRVRRIRADGVIEAVAGGGRSLTGTDPRALRLDALRSVCASPGGGVFIASGARIFEVSGGVLQPVAGGRGPGFRGDEGPAVRALLAEPDALTLTSSGDLCFVDRRNHRVRCIDSGARTITTLFGGGTRPIAELAGGRRVRATELQLFVPLQLTATSDGRIVLATNRTPDGTYVHLLATSPTFFRGPGGEALIPAPDGTEMWIFAPDGRHLRTVETLVGRTIARFEYDATGALEAVVNQLGQRVSVERRDGSPERIVGPFGDSALLTTDSNGWLASVRDAESGEWRLAHDDEGLLLSLVSPTGETSTFTHRAGRLTRDEHPDGTATVLESQPALGPEVTVRGPGPREVERFGISGSSTERFAEDSDGLFVRVVRALGTDEIAGEDHTAEYPDGSEATVTVVSDPRFGTFSGHVGRIVARTPGGRTLRISETVDVAPEEDDDISTLPPTTRRTVLGTRVRTTSWDPAVRTLETRTGTGLVTRTVLDDLGRISSTAAPGLEPIRYEYDAAGFLQRVVSGPAGAERVWQYEHVDGVLVAETDPLGRRATFARDAVGRTRTVMTPDGRTISLGYGADDRITSVQPPGREAYSLSYTPTGDLESISPPAGDASPIDRVSSDEAGRPVGRSRGSAIVTLERDAASGRLVAATIDGLRFSREYDAAGRLATHAQGPERTTFTYDGSLVTAVRQTGTVAADLAIEYEDGTLAVSAWALGGTRIELSRDDDGVVSLIAGLGVTRSATHGFATTTTLESISSAHSVSPFGEETLRRFTRGGTLLYEHQVTARDALGRIVRARETIGGIARDLEYEYDSADRLFRVRAGGVEIERYGWHPNGSRLTFSRGGESGVATFATDERMTSHGVETFTHRDDGTVTTRSSPGGPVSYDIDSAGALRRVDLADGRVVQYVLDGIGRRIARRVDGVFDRGWVYGHGRRPIAEIDGAGAIRSVFVWRPGSLAPDVMIRDGVAHRIVADPRGSVRLVVRASDGVIVQRMDYDSFGRVLADSSPGTTPFGFAGGLYDPDTRLVRFGAREYDASTGTFLGPDPSSLAGGLNQFAYAAGDPVNRIDPDGQIPVLVVVLAEMAVYGVASVGAGFGVRALANRSRGVGWVDCVTPPTAREVATDFVLGMADAGMGSFADDAARLTRRSADDVFEHICRGGWCRCGSWPEGTLVHTSSGLVPIEAIAPGDEVLSQDERTGELAYRAVAVVVEHPVDETLAIELVHGSESDVIEPTGEHPLFVDARGWLPARELATGDRVLLASGDWGTIGAITTVLGTRRVVDLVVPGPESFFVGAAGVWVHNGGCTRRGFPRHNPRAWRRLRDSWDVDPDYRNILSPVNRGRIARGVTPRVDPSWVHYFPGDAPLMGETIPMHHINGSLLTVPLPSSRHLDAHMPGGFRFNPGGPGISGRRGPRRRPSRRRGAPRRTRRSATTGPLHG